MRGFVEDEGSRGASVPLGAVAEASSRVRRAPAFSGRKPRNWKSDVERPEAISAVTCSVGTWDGRDCDAGGDGGLGEPDCRGR